MAGRSLTFPFIAGSLLLTNLSTEQMVGLNGSAFKEGFCVMAWEIMAVLALVIMAIFFLPRFLKSGVTTVPEYLQIRFDKSTALITNIIFLLAYMFILLPIVLYTGAEGLNGIMNISELTGIDNASKISWFCNLPTNLVIMVWFVGIVGMVYALFGGLKSVAVSDTINGIGLLIGGFMIVYYGFAYVGGDACFISGVEKVYNAMPERFNSIGGPQSEVPFFAVFTGMMAINMFYWCTNQQIIQRTFAASSLAEEQKGVFLCGFYNCLALYIWFCQE